MFTRHNLIESDEGYTVRLLDTQYMGYSEGERKLQFIIEILAKPLGYCLFKQSIKKWESPHDDEVINDAERDRIILNVEKALQFAGYRVQIDDRK